jgi:hypothetical protein
MPPHLSITVSPANIQDISDAMIFAVQRSQSLKSNAVISTYPSGVVGKKTGTNTRSDIFHPASVCTKRSWYSPITMGFVSVCGSVSLCP